MHRAVIIRIGSIRYWTTNANEATGFIVWAKENGMDPKIPDDLAKTSFEIPTITRLTAVD
jgi:hypothetical protein